MRLKRIQRRMRLSSRKTSSESRGAQPKTLAIWNALRSLRHTALGDDNRRVEAAAG